MEEQTGGGGGEGVLRVGERERQEVEENTLSWSLYHVLGHSEGFPYINPVR